MDFIFGLIEPHLGEAIGFIAGAIATGLVWITQRTKTTIDDDLLHETAKKIKEKKGQ